MSGNANSGRNYGARPTPAELVRRALLELEATHLRFLSQDYDGQPVLEDIRRIREGLVEKLEPARWRGSGRRSRPDTALAEEDERTA